ncbi:MAG: copper amine oxidase N-terminal domain-containing protein [Candidatus Eremiobacteraeota bacterium]|nr:copper amine oxidase N-terminal domain-containing protein [Candidatus Eremiobacteraeota bacterium]MBC5825216.1 copper amine oxidase N-terminal domain-containing protein [Candidatus Eremiobacteraeota bacterium]
MSTYHANTAVTAICPFRALAAAAHAPAIYVNGSQTNVPAIQRANRVFVPARSVFEKIGAAVEYSRSGNVTARKGRRTLANLTLGDRTAKVRGATLLLDAAPFRAGNRVYVPLRLISEAAGATVSYGRNPRTVRISGVQTVAAAAPVVEAAPVTPVAPRHPLVGMVAPRAHRPRDPLRVDAPRQSRTDHHDNAVGKRRAHDTEFG